MSIVSNVKRLHRSGKYRTAVELLETNILLHRDDPEFLLQLALSYIYSQDYSSAQEILEKIARTHRGDNSIDYLNAVIAIMNQDSNRALDIWVNLLRGNAHDAIARRGLELLKTKSAAKIKSSYNKYRVLRTLIPRKLQRSPISQPLRIGIGIGLFVLFAGAMTMLLRIVDIPLFTTNSELIIQDIPIQRSEIVGISKDSKYQLSDVEINEMLKSIQRAFNAFDDAEVCRSINYLLHSNISNSLHNKLVSISQLLKTPSFISLTESVAIAEVLSSPWLYHTCFIRWSGRAIEVQLQTDGTTQFMLYVGYEDTSILEGIVSSRMTIDYDIQEAEAIELLGQLTTSETEIIALDIVDVRPLYQ